jgi:hypothetical protein
MCPPQLMLEISNLCARGSARGSARDSARGHSHGAALGVPRVPLGSVQQDLEAAQQQLLQRGQQWVVCIGLCVIVVLPA